MEIIRVQDGVFEVPGQTLQHRAALKDVATPGFYNLCKSGQNWKLYHTASIESQPVLITDTKRVKEAKQALLEWHKAECKDCIELAPGSWSHCAEGQELLAGS